VVAVAGGKEEKFMLRLGLQKLRVNRYLVIYIFMDVPLFLLFVKVLKIPDADPCDYLKQGGIVKKIRETYHKSTRKHR